RTPHPRPHFLSPTLMSSGNSRVTELTTLGGPIPHGKWRGVTKFLWKTACRLRSAGRRRPIVSESWPAKFARDVQTSLFGPLRLLAGHDHDFNQKARVGHVCLDAGTGRGAIF